MRIKAKESEAWCKASRPKLTEKECRACARELPTTEFTRKNSSSDGLSPDCKKCFTQKRKEKEATWASSRTPVAEKHCPRCQDPKTDAPLLASAFNKDNKRKDGLSRDCKECIKKIREPKKEKYYESTRAWREKNPENARLSKLRSRERHPETDRLYRERNAHKFEVWRREWYAKNRAERCAQMTKYKKERLKSDPAFRFFIAVRDRNRNLVKDLIKKGVSYRARPATREALGIEPVDFIVYIESLFSPHPKTGEAMTFENYGTGWEIDHVRPLASFGFCDAKTPEEFTEIFKRAGHYTNLQPLWKDENRRKSSKYGGKMHRLRAPARRRPRGCQTQRGEFKKS